MSRVDEKLNISKGSNGSQVTQRSRQARQDPIYIWNEYDSLKQKSDHFNDEADKVQEAVGEGFDLYHRVQNKIDPFENAFAQVESAVENLVWILFVANQLLLPGSPSTWAQRKKGNQGGLSGPSVDPSPLAKSTPLTCSGGEKDKTPEEIVISEEDGLVKVKVVEKLI